MPLVLTSPVPGQTRAGQEAVVRQDLQLAQDYLNNEVEPAFSAYQTIVERGGPGGTVAVYTGGQVFYLAQGVIGAHTSPVNGSAAYVPAFFFAPSDYPGGSRTLKVRVSGEVACNGVAIGGVVTLGLVGLTVSGAAGSLVYTDGASLASVAVNALPNAATHGVGAAIPAPAPGWYALYIFMNTAPPAGCVIQPRATLQITHV